MTIKSLVPRTKFEAEKKEERVRYLKREQEERETKQSLKDYLRHVKEEDASTD